MYNIKSLSILFFFTALVYPQDSGFKLGLENITDKDLKQLFSSGNLKIGLITNQTGIDQKKERNIDIFLNKGIKIEAIYAPEHGLDGIKEGGHAIDNTSDKVTGIPVISLYTGDSQFRKFKKEDLQNIDSFVFDIQDSGTRHYTYISILYKIMEVALEFNKPVIVLDRPNPLGCPMEGPSVEPKWESFVSIAPVPLRHAMTVGELALYFNKFRLKKPVNLHVIQMRNYKRDMGLGNNLPEFLSPNIRNLDACKDYSFLGIFEALRPFSVLKNTEHAFKCLMLPDSIKFDNSQWEELIEILKKRNISAELFKHKNFSGIKFEKIVDINKISSFNIMLDILESFRKSGIDFAYPIIFNKLVGSEMIRNFMDKKISRAELTQQINRELPEFFAQVKDLLIYKPLPKVVKAD